MLWWKLRPLKSSSAQTRAETARSLGARGDAGAVPALTAALADEAAEVRRAAAAALAQLAHPAAAEPLCAALARACPRSGGHRGDGADAAEPAELAAAIAALGKQRRRTAPASAGRRRQRRAPLGHSRVGAGRRCRGARPADRPTCGPALGSPAGSGPRARPARRLRRARPARDSPWQQGRPHAPRRGRGPWGPRIRARGRSPGQGRGRPQRADPIGCGRRPRPHRRHACGDGVEKGDRRHRAQVGARGRDRGAERHKGPCVRTRRPRQDRGARAAASTRPWPRGPLPSPP